MAKKVLIIEDEKNIAELLQLYLEKEGFETRTALDGGKGLGVPGLPARPGAAGRDAAGAGRVDGVPPHPGA